MISFDMIKTFKNGDLQRGNFLSRLFGIFNEEIVRIWCRNENSKYVDLGRPTIYENDKWTRTTLDYGLKTNDGRIFVGELKCEIALANFKYFELNSVDQLEHHSKPSFNRFLKLAVDPTAYQIKINGKFYDINGAILLWGKIDKTQIDCIKDQYGFFDILSLERIINNLRNWNDTEYKKYINRLNNWTSELMKSIK